MHLIIFDIDGTILDSVDEDDKCFIQTFADLYQLDLGAVAWNDFKHVTDAWMTTTIFKQYFDRGPSAEELNQMKTRYYQLLNGVKHKFKAVRNALHFIEDLHARRDCIIGFATGGWGANAMLKCSSVGLDLERFIFKTSSDHYDRGRIVDLVVQEAQVKHKLKGFDSITYFGDGLWDYRTTQMLGINFMGVDIHGNGKLAQVGVKQVIRDYTHPELILSWIKDNNGLK